MVAQDQFFGDRDIAGRRGNQARAVGKHGSQVHAGFGRPDHRNPDNLTGRVQTWVIHTINDDRRRARSLGFNGALKNARCSQDVVNAPFNRGCASIERNHPYTSVRVGYTSVCLNVGFIPLTGDGWVNHGDIDHSHLLQGNAWVQASLDEVQQQVDNHVENGDYERGSDDHREIDA